jgi:hypothetical protein
MNETSEEFEKEGYEAFKSANNLSKKGPRFMSYFILDHEKRLKDIENKIYPKRLEATRPQKMVILDLLGIVGMISNLNTSANKKAELLSVITGEDMSNIKGDLRSIQSKDSELRKEHIYQFVVDFFERLGLKDKEDEADKILVEIQKENEKKGNIKRKSKK